MNVLSWNCRGLGNQRAFQFLKEIVSQKKPNFIFLCETKSDKSKMQRVGRALGFEGMFIVEAQGSAGGLVMFWRFQAEGRLLGYSTNHIDIMVSSPERGERRLTGVYGEPVRNRRHLTWELLRFLSRDSNLPWCVIGDLNNVMRQEDKRGGRRYPHQLITGFQQALTDCNLHDMELTGYPFTWEKGRGTQNWVEVRLDRALITPTFSQVFPLAVLTNLELSSSDHCPILLEPDIVQQFTPSHNNLAAKIKKCADVPGPWGKEITVLDQREAFWKQRSKQLWLKEGDQNSSYFHKTATTRKRHNQIDRLQDGHGNWVYWENGLPMEITSYFNNLFQSAGGTFQEIIDCVNTSIPEIAHEEFRQPVTEEEVKRAVFQMHPDKSPGPDGMTPAFYQKSWSIVGKDVIQMVHNFLATGEFEEGCADANIVLIPKNKKPENMTQLRPIALCNVSYKIITKVVVNRMKPFMDRVVSENQSAFIPGRLISDNVLISFEVLHYLKRKRKWKDGFMALKLDMSKAYDRIEWNFLEAMLHKLGFENWWTRRLVKCVSSACYTVIHGRHEIGPIIPSRGIRQGDPLSLYLFILCAEGLSAILQRYEARGLLHGCKVANGAPRISHMLFADDSYLYCKATMEETTRVQEVLSKFEEASGQKVNYSKSSIFFSTNTTLSTRNNISQRLGMSIAGTNSLYLGLPSTISRNKTAVFGYLKERVRKRIDGWESKFLSRAGKEILIKTVAQSLPSYAMSVFLIPIDITREMEKIMTKLWWQSSNKSGKGIHWLSWDRLCTHKKKGGMGFRHLRDFNLSLLGKQGWRLLVQPDSLVAKIFKARYYPNNSYLDASLGNNPSFVWRSVWEAQQLVRKGLRWCVGDGTEINVLNEPWLPCSDNPYVSTSHPSLIGAKVHSLMKINDTGWDMEILEDLFEERDRRLIVKIPLQQSAAKDTLTWAYEASGIYSVKSAYKLLQQVNGRWDNDDDAASTFWATMWRLKIPPKVKNTLWRAGKNCLPTLCMLQTKRVNVNSLCPICREEEETILHALVTCSHIKQVWDRVGIGTNITPDITLFLDWCIRVFTGADSSKRCLIATLCWAIWSARNDFVWQKKVVNADRIVVLARGYLDQWTNAQNTLIESSWSGFQTGDGVEQWSAPSENSIKINVDAALFEDGTSHRIGMVARDHHGFLVEGRTEHFQGAATPEVAEAIGVREALSWIKKKNWQQASIETDCLMVVQALRNSIKMLSLFGQIIDECKRLSSELKHVSIFFVKRSANVVAHNFARASILFPGCLFGMESVPTDLLHCLVTEFVG
ncbi:uncharacterized protein LOC115713780 [Cannabis sativa]|uniref:uncharacterized protein LOC115713780 n=1 Tax=Cannabis sativa TaxID=3483 RepID=UPI0029CA6D29|nr:uncharacterized protein LOC115713780 [Cannabis sativa]